MEPKLLHILQHSLGVDQFGQGRQYRNHFATSPGSKDFDDCSSLVEMGLMIDHGPLAISGRMHCFCVTPAGVDVVAMESPSPPKKTRSQIDYEYVSEITCPYCGWKDRDSWEHGLRDGEDVDIECGQCDESFNVGCCIDVSYTSEKKA